MYDGTYQYFFTTNGRIFTIHMGNCDRMGDFEAEYVAIYDTDLRHPHNPAAVNKVCELRIRVSFLVLAQLASQGQQKGDIWEALRRAGIAYSEPLMREYATDGEVSVGEDPTIPVHLKGLENHLRNVGSSLPPDWEGPIKLDF